jgi:hypothetical protein
VTSAGEAGRAGRPFVEKFIYPTLGAAVVAVASAAITYFVAKPDPGIKLRELTAKSAIADKIGEYSATAVISAQSVANRSVLTGAEDPAQAFQLAYDTHLAEWKAKSTAVGSEIEAEVGDDLARRWGDFSGVVLDYYRLSADPSAERTASVVRLQEATSDPGIDWAVLQKGLATRPGHTYADIPAQQRARFQSAYEQLGNDVLKAERTLVAEVVAARGRGV